MKFALSEVPKTGFLAPGPYDIRQKCNYKKKVKTITQESCNNEYL